MTFVCVHFVTKVVTVVMTITFPGQEMAIVKMSKYFQVLY